MRIPDRRLLAIGKMILGCGLFGLGFNLFLQPNGLNAGGLSGLSMLFVHIAKFGSVGTVTAVLNLPLFAVAGIRIGRKFFFASILGMVFGSLFIDLLVILPQPATEPLVGALYGGVLCGLGLGMVFSTGGSTGGSDIIVRLIKQKRPYMPIGVIAVCFDMAVAALTGIVFRDISRALYSGVAIFVSGQVIDAVVYRFDYSRVALIISKEHQSVAAAIARNLGRGATYLHGQGCYSGKETKVVLTAVKRQQLADLKRVVVETDPEAFIIVQEAHQVLGDGFVRYSADAL